MGIMWACRTERTAREIAAENSLTYGESIFRSVGTVVTPSGCPWYVGSEAELKAIGVTDVRCPRCGAPHLNDSHGPVDDPCDAAG
jgi:hypothetical protein